MPAQHRIPSQEKISQREQRRIAFGGGLADALAGRNLTQADLAELLSTTQSTISAWINGRSEPEPVTVFAVEEAIGVSPGFLSRLLGYLPLSVVGAAPSVEEAISRSDSIDDTGRRLVLTVWHTLVEKHQSYLKAVNGGGATRRTRSKGSTKAAAPPAPRRTTKGR
jgi:transcriptional regulator with XRE-family HTH domain